MIEVIGKLFCSGLPADIVLQNVPVDALTTRNVRLTDCEDVHWIVAQI